jgi:hypothetical protein
MHTDFETSCDTEFDEWGNAIMHSDEHWHYLKSNDEIEHEYSWDSMGDINAVYRKDRWEQDPLFRTQNEYIDRPLE